MADEKDKKEGKKHDDAVQAPAVNAGNEVEELKKKSEEYLNGWKRAQADYQNLTKETAKWRVEFVKFANENLILELLPVLDNFEAAFSQILEAEKNSASVVGFAHIKKQMEDLFKANGVERIKTVGEKFDPERHEAVEHRHVEGAEQGVIVEEKRAGYQLNGKVVQAAKVVVAD